MRPDPVEEGRRWLDQAILDLDDARFARDGKRFSLACFMCQQAAEKAVKGFLVLHGKEMVWGHSVADLCERASGFADHFAALRDDGASLDLLYIPTRYPNGLPGGLPSDAFHEDDADRAIVRAERIIGSAREAFEGN
jgi:HEPN domain-containing protein